MVHLTMTLRGKLPIGLFLILAGLGVLGWLRKDRLLAWYYVERLARATEFERDNWVRKTAGLGRAAHPSLVACFQRSRLSSCENARLAACQIIKADADGELSAALAEAFLRFSADGQRCALDVARFLVQQYPDRALTAAPLLIQCVQAEDPDVRLRALALVESPGKTADGDWLRACRTMARACLRDDATEIRTRAMRLALRPGIDLIGEIVPLLRDPAPEIRRAAIVAVGPMPEAIATDDLLAWLHDGDDEVRRLCEGVLRGRGLQDHHLKMGRLITDPRPVTRIAVLDYLRQNSDLEPGVWLRRLSRDPAPSVRAATVRFAGEDATVDLSQRLEQMAHDDPSPTIRQLARFYSANVSRQP